MDRERITISIRKNVLDEVDRTIDGTTIRNRSHAIESLIKKGVGISDNKNAIILLGGENALSRISVVKDTISKLKDESFDKVYIAVGYLKDKIIEALGDGENFGIDIIYSDKGEGTAGAILPIKGKLISTFIVFNSESKATFSLKDLLSFHKKHRLKATVATDNEGLSRGIYVFEPSVFDYIPAGFSMIEETVFPKLISENELAIFPLFSR